MPPAAVGVDEVRRASALRTGTLAENFLHARHTARMLVAKVEGCPASGVELCSHDDAAPSIAGLPTLGISWSRSGPLAFAAVLRDGRIGCDIEQVRPLSHLAMLSMIASPAEAALIRGLTSDEGETPLAFFRLWTAKEAVLKWQGDGLRGGAKSVDIPAGLLSGNVRQVEVERDAGAVLVRQIDTAQDRVAMIAFSARR